MTGLSAQSRLAPAPMVSVVIVFFNAERFFEEAVASVFAQTYTSWELLLVDDGSTDTSSALARRYAAERPDRVRHLEHPGHANLGISASRNAGVRNARGKYIALLDADDIWLPSKLEEQVAILERHPAAALVYGRSLVWYGWTGDPADARRDRFYPLGIEPNRVVQPPALFLRLLENRVQSPTPCNVLIRADTFARVGGFEEEFRGMFEDHAFFAKTHLHLPVYVSDRHWANYRRHAGSCSTAARPRHIAIPVRRGFLEWVERYIDDSEHAANPEIRRLLRRERLRCRYPRAAALADRVRARLGLPLSRFQSAADARGTAG